jgi:predicted GNAT family N-acyltransferase
MILFMSEVKLETVKVTETWQLAGVYYVRTEGMVKGFNIPLSLEFENDSPDSNYMLLLENGFPAATCRPRILDKTTAKIERVCVLSNSRGKNLGRKLITDTEAWLKQQGIRTVIIASRDAVVGFYEKLGYTADWKQVHEGFFKEVHTEKEL